MLRLKDIILLVVLFSSMTTGILLPGFASVFQPYPLYLMMFFLFLSLLPIRIDNILYTARKSSRSILVLTFLKLIVLPLAIYVLFKAIFPSYAVAALLLTGISTGVVAPFISNLLKANSSLVLVMVVVSSLLAPFTLPLLVKLLLGRSIEISLIAMMRMLCMVIFVPIAAAEILKRFAPRVKEGLMKRNFPISLVVFSMIMLGVFSRYAGFFYQRPSTILVATAVATVLAGIYAMVGLAFLWRGTLEDQLGAAVSLAHVNNVLVIVFSSQFFGPLEPTLSAMYIIPFFGLILPLRSFSQRRKGMGSAGSE
jgi:BASS family bile acid:Na+ symporter